MVFWFQGDPNKSYIKRVIGLPGDTVEIRDGTVIVNGKPLSENYVPKQYRDTQWRPPVKLGPGQYYVLGDHRSSSNDSRNWGPVERKQIYGKAVFVYWPLEKMGPID